MRLSSPWLCFDKAHKVYVFDSVNAVKEFLSFSENFALNLL